MEDKSALRRRMKAAREGWEAEYRQKADAAIARHVLASEVWRAAGTVFAYVSVGCEVDTRALIEAALAKVGVAGERLVLELTESAIVGDPDRVSAIMKALKTLGTTIAMDDFGTGYSNLAYLQKLPIDILKIDRSFVLGMLADRDKIAIVRAILGLAQALGMKTTAEGIETVELGQTLAALGCSHGQGYYYARPLEPAAAWAMIANQA